MESRIRVCRCIAFTFIVSGAATSPISLGWAGDLSSDKKPAGKDQKYLLSAGLDGAVQVNVVLRKDVQPGLFIDVAGLPESNRTSRAGKFIRWG